LVEDRVYNIKDFDRNLVIDERTKIVARRVSEFLEKTDRFDKTIVFCVDIEHARRMRKALTIENSDLALDNYKYVMCITGDDEQGKRELDNFINPEERYPVIATTSKLMTTGVDAQTCKLIVLDSNIHSMTEFKQIIGRGTRINEEYGKMYFTIMDFRNVTDLFADPDFDGPPIMVKEVGGEEEFREQDIHPGESVIDPETGNPVDFGEEEPTTYDTHPRIIPGGSIVSEPSQKVYVSGVDVLVLNERVQYLDANGKVITENLRDYTKRSLLAEFRSLDDFLARWNGTQKKMVIVNELESRGIILENLESEVKKDIDIFDLICHIAWDMPALTRRERAEKVKKKDYFAKYGEKAREVIEALLEKYANEGVENIENLEVLRVDPFDKMGTPTEIVRIFGGRYQYTHVVEELQREIYAIA